MARLVGPFVGGVTLEIGLWVAFGVDAMTFVVASLIVLTLPRQRAARVAPATDRRGMWSEFGDAVEAMRALLVDLLRPV